MYACDQEVLCGSRQVCRLQTKRCRQALNREEPNYRFSTGPVDMPEKAIDNPRLKNRIMLSFRACSGSSSGGIRLGIS